MKDPERKLAEREAQIIATTDEQHWAPVVRGDIQNLERTIILSARLIAETIMKARY